MGGPSGTARQFQFMTESILYAWDAWLKGKGSSGQSHLRPCSANKDYGSKLLFWDNTCKFNLSTLKSLAVKGFFQSPSISTRRLFLWTVHCITAGHENSADCWSGDNEKPAVLWYQESRHSAWICCLVQGPLSEPGAGWTTAGAEPGTVPPHHPLEAGAVCDGRAHPRPCRGRGQGSVVLQRNPVWRRHMSIALSWSVTFQTRPHVTQSGRKSLSDLEMTAEILCGKQCELTGGEHRWVKEVTPGCEPLFLWKPANAHSAWQVVTPFSVGSTDKHAQAALTNARACVCPVELGCASRCPLWCPQCRPVGRVGAQCS